MCPCARRPQQVLDAEAAPYGLLLRETSIYQELLSNRAEGVLTAGPLVQLAEGCQDGKLPLRNASWEHMPLR